jgi:hypothetical protein
MSDKMLFLSRKKTSKKKDGEGDACFAELNALLGQGYGEDIGAKLFQGQGEGYGPMSISVGLDNRHDFFAWSRGIPGLLKIMPQSVKIDLRVCRPGGEHNAGKPLMVSFEKSWKNLQTPCFLYNHFIINKILKKARDIYLLGKTENS